MFDQELRLQMPRILGYFRGSSNLSSQIKASLLESHIQQVGMAVYLSPKEAFPVP
jgi:hypothetical protein